MEIAGMGRYVRTAFVTVLIAVVPVPVAEAGWVWTPETGWMNSRQTPKATAKEQFEDAGALYEKGKYDRAGAAFSMVRRFYPDSQFAEEADFLETDCLFREKHYERAYKRLEQFMKNFPDSRRRVDAIELEIKIGRKFLDGAKKKILGMKIMPAREKGIKIIETAIEHDRFHERAPEALMILGDVRLAGELYGEARKYYSRIVKEYPKSPLKSKAEYQLAFCDEKAVDDVVYDTSSFLKVEKKYRRLAAIGGGEVGDEAEKQVGAMRNKRAQKEFDTAEFYRKTRKTRAAIMYYKSVVKNFTDTEWAGKAQEWLGKLSEK